MSIGIFRHEVTTMVVITKWKQSPREGLLHTYFTGIAYWSTRSWTVFLTSLFNLYRPLHGITKNLTNTIRLRHVKIKEKWKYIYIHKFHSYLHKVSFLFTDLGWLDMKTVMWLNTLTWPDIHNSIGLCIQVKTCPLICTIFHTPGYGACEDVSSFTYDLLYICVCTVYRRKLRTCPHMNRMCMKCPREQTL